MVPNECKYSGNRFQLCQQTPLLLPSRSCSVHEVAICLRNVATRRGEKAQILIYSISYETAAKNMFYTRTGIKQDNP